MGVNDGDTFPDTLQETLQTVGMKALSSTTQHYWLHHRRPARAMAR